ncbi:phosphodiesterase [Streptomyces sp. NPDC006864]|uniref:phosphodiesterase n=1 Tax=Streptomyces sp. NPDC006864 TaxID=3154780 RepID=UPI0034570C3A
MTRILLAHLSDTHLRVNETDHPAEHGLATALDRLGRFDTPVTAVIVTGDLTHDGSPNQYRQFERLLDRAQVPVLLVKGNHDRDEGIRAAALHPRAVGPAAPEGAFQYVANLGGLRVVVCDTTVPGEHWGLLDGERLAWLCETLAAEPGRPTVVAMHHPPIEVGIPYLDEIGLLNRAKVAEVIAAAPQVLGVLAGHVHRTVSGRIGTAQVVTAPSTYRACAFRLSPGYGAYTTEPPGFAVHSVDLAGETGVVSHLLPLEEGDRSEWTRSAAPRRS